MKGFVTNVEKEALDNGDFRRVLYTSKNLQLVLMSLRPMEDIGEEVHELDQFFRVESGVGKSVLNGEERELQDGSVVIISAGTMHNIINTSAESHMKLYTLYSPPNHKDGVVHKTKAEAKADEEHFDGGTTLE